MFSNTLSVLLVCLLSDFSSGQKFEKFFRNDYHYIESLDSFYKFHTERKTWHNAKRVCALEGAILFYPENHDEADEVISFWNGTQPDYSKVYVGMSDLMAKGVFETIDGKLITEVYNNWQNGVPQHEYDDDCVYLHIDGYIKDYSCSRYEAFICKKSLVSLQWDFNCNMPNLDYSFSKDIGKCYKFHKTPLDWNEAYAVCRTEQTYLAVINDQKEMDFLVKLTEEAPKLRLGADYQRGIFHLGFHNQRNEGWQTVRGTPFNDDSSWWGNYQADVDSVKKCGSMFYTGRLNNVNCDTKSFFICEHEPSSSSLTSSLTSSVTSSLTSSETSSSTSSVTSSLTSSVTSPLTSSSTVSEDEQELEYPDIGI